MRRREGDGCPLTGALQLVGDRWTLLIVRDLARGARRTTELLASLHPISSRTLVARLRDMEHDQLIVRRDLGGSPPHVEYVLNERGQLLLPLLQVLRELGQTLECNSCDERRQRTGSFCDICPHQSAPDARTPHARRHEPDDSIVLL